MGWRPKRRPKSLALLYVRQVLFWFMRRRSPFAVILYAPQKLMRFR